VVRTDVEDFWAAYFSARGGTYTRISEMELFTGKVVSACGTVDSPAYCPLDRVVYLESRFMQTELADFGDFGSAVVVAHEIGHCA
jgi:predicted metalloprotease